MLEEHEIQQYITKIKVNFILQQNHKNLIITR